MHCTMTRGEIKEVRLINGLELKMTCIPLQTMLVLDDIVPLWTVARGAMATQTDHRPPVQRSILTQLLCCSCATWLNN